MTMVRTEAIGDVLLIEINNPPINAGSLGVRQGLMAAVEQLAADPALRAGVLIGAGSTFVAGSDLREFGQPLQEPLLPAVLAGIEACAKPVVAALHGAALGGEDDHAALPGPFHQAVERREPAVAADGFAEEETCADDDEEGRGHDERDGLPDRHSGEARHPGLNAEGGEQDAQDVADRIGGLHGAEAEPEEQRKREDESEAILPEGGRGRREAERHREPLGDDIENGKGNACQNHKSGTDNGPGAQNRNRALIHVIFP